MLITYFDEVKYKPREQPYYWIGGLTVSPESILTLENALGELSREFFGTSIVSEDTEFHAADIFHRKKHYRKFTDVGARIELLKRIAKIIDGDKGVAKIHVKIEIANMITDKDVEGKAFMFFVEKVEEYLRANKKQGIIIGDRENDTISKKFSKELSQYRENKTHYEFGRKLEKVIDTVHFTSSSLSRMLQLADTFVWILQLCANTDDDNRARNDVKKFIREETNLLSPTKYKHWPTEQSWRLNI